MPSAGGLASSPAGAGFPRVRRLNPRLRFREHYQVVGGSRKGENPVHLEDSTMPNLPQQRNRLQPAETFFDPLPLFLADTLAHVPCRAAIERAATGPLVILRHLRPHMQVPSFGHEIHRAVALVSACRHPLPARNLLQPHQRRITLCPLVGLEHSRVHDQPVAICGRGVNFWPPACLRRR